MTAAMQHADRMHDAHESSHAAAVHCDTTHMDQPCVMHADGKHGACVSKHVSGDAWCTLTTAMLHANSSHDAWSYVHDSSHDAC